jgi:hypothetical protein
MSAQQKEPRPEVVDARDRVNESGYPLQIALAHAVKARTNAHGWRVLYEEHAWKYEGREGFIDIVLEQEKLQVVLLVECKRPKDGEWVFLPGAGDARLRRHARARRVERENAKVRANFPQWSDQPLDPKTPEAVFCVAAKMAGATVDNVGAELIAATEALEREECGYLDRRGGNSRRLYFAAIVTTANLTVCSFDPNSISLADGKIPDGAEISSVGAVRYTKQLSTKPISGTPVAGTGQEARALSLAKERTVFIINAQKLNDFLVDFNVDDIKRS